MRPAVAVGERIQHLSVLHYNPQALSCPEERQLLELKRGEEITVRHAGAMSPRMACTGPTRTAARVVWNLISCMPLLYLH
ncbi:hypothetical protein PVAP13_3KG034427 [Panicum virgatum]|uniref:Uncharacterized protein n=1 Tax=Panicum virgatum TaxID=38727 RepID=A0A8T0UM73_PANVG|nr:hypothetical protein PVAP13_3KG034427 [Panicum virgatum]